MKTQSRFTSSHTTHLVVNTQNDNRRHVLRHMRHTICGPRVFIIAMCALLSATSAHCADPNLKSNTIELKGARQWLEASGANVLMICRKSSDGLITQSKIWEFGGKRVRQMRLRSWLSTAIAIIRVEAEKENEYWCFTFKFNSDKESLITEGEACIFKCADAYEIVSVDGQCSGDSVFIVLGDTGVVEGVRIASKGVLLLNSCPRPPLAEATVVVPWTGTPIIPDLKEDRVNSGDSVKKQ